MGLGMSSEISSADKFFHKRKNKNCIFFHTNKYKRFLERKLIRLYNKSPLKVHSGPFNGLKYVDHAVGSAYIPKLAGSYEKELARVMNTIAGKGFQTIIDVGAAEGYYAVGMARLLPRSKVIAFESETAGQQLIKEMAVLNQCANIDIRGECDPSQLRTTLSCCDLNSTCIIMDVEGYERTLLDPALIPDLKQVHVLLEVHDCHDPDLAALIFNRFKDSHCFEEIVSTVRTKSDMPSAVIKQLPWYCRTQRAVQNLLNEQRGATMRWFWMQPIKRAEL